MVRRTLKYDMLDAGELAACPLINVSTGTQFAYVVKIAIIYTIANWRIRASI